MEIIVGIVVGIIVLISVLNKAKKKKEIAKLEICDVGYCAQLIRYTLEEKGFIVSEPQYSLKVMHTKTTL